MQWVIRVLHDNREKGGRRRTDSKHQKDNGGDKRGKIKETSKWDSRFLSSVSLSFPLRSVASVFCLVWVMSLRFLSSPLKHEAVSKYFLEIEQLFATPSPPISVLFCVPGKQCTSSDVRGGFTLICQSIIPSASLLRCKALILANKWVQKEMRFHSC